MTQSLIGEALVQAYENGNFNLFTSYENIAFTPKAGVPWAELKLILNQPEVATLGNHGQDSHDGIFQIDLNYPTGESKGNISQKADEIRQYFKAGRSFMRLAQAVTIISCGASRGFNVSGWYRVSMSVAWYARTPR